LIVVDHHAVHQDGMEAGMLSDTIHHLLVIFQGNIDEDSHRRRLVSLPYAIASDPCPFALVRDKGVAGEILDCLN
jgi:hypothetical protein